MNVKNALLLIEDRLKVHGIEDYLTFTNETQWIHASLSREKKLFRTSEEITLNEKTYLFFSLSQLVQELMKKRYNEQRDIFAKELVNYVDSHYANNKRYTLSNEQEIIHSITNSRLIYVEDNHFVTETKYTLIDLLRNILRQSKATIALESIRATQQGLLEMYQYDEIEYQDFLNELLSTGLEEPAMIDYSKEIYDFIRQNKNDLTAIGMDKEGALDKSQLNKRDINGAKKIIKRLQESEEPIVVFAGTGHVAKEHLPRIVKEISGINGIIIYQNIPKLYLKLLKRRISPEGKILKLSSNEFCVFSLNPLEELISMQDYRNWLDDESENQLGGYKRNAAQLYTASLIMLQINERDYLDKLEYIKEYITNKKKESDRLKKLLGIEAA